MASGAQKDVAEFVSGKMSENYSVAQTATVGKLFGVVREHVRHCSEAAVFRDQSKAEAVLGLA